jgi:CDP-diacylglycerol--glycerol-3-phosphate 3-phosphatidyltransferase
MKSNKKGRKGKTDREAEQREELKKALKEELKEELREDLKKEAPASEKIGKIEKTEHAEKAKMNLPNKLTILRILLVPAVMVFIYIESDAWSRIAAAAVFLIISVTDMLDGIIARKYNLITNFGKLMDPLADKFMVVGALIAITASDNFATLRFLSVWVTAAVFFRELAVTSVRLVATTSDGSVIAASFIGKIKTFAQCVCIMTVLLEEVIIVPILGTNPILFSTITMSVMLAVTVYSGFEYLKNYWKYIDPAK